jgi:hypothetical protein
VWSVARLYQVAELHLPHNMVGLDTFFRSMYQSIRSVTRQIDELTVICYTTVNFIWVPMGSLATRPVLILTPMEYDKFDNDAEDTTDEEYFAFVEWLSAQTVVELHAVKGNAEGERQALIRYYRRGELANVTTDELIDFLAVSSSNILENAGYSDEESDALMAISDSLTDDISLGMTDVESKTGEQA